MMWYITISQLDIAVVLMCGIFSIVPLYMAAVLMVWYMILPLYIAAVLMVWYSTILPLYIAAVLMVWYI
jgi:hypothetical protein